MWENFEFLSPNFAHKTFDLWNHNLFSLTIKSVISCFSSLTENPKIVPRTHGYLFWRSLYALTKSLFTLPKWFRFLLPNSFPHFSNFRITLIAGSATSLEYQTTSTSSEQPQSKSHISWNLIGLVIHGISKLLGMIHNGQWSEESNWRWWIFELENFHNQSLFANP